MNAETKYSYFRDLGLSHREELDAHRANGLWDREGSSERSWGNVTEHCLVVAARVEILADWVGLPSWVKQDLMKGAILHDFYKRREKEFLCANPKFEIGQYNAFSMKSGEFLRAAGFDELVVELAGSLADDKLPEIEKRLEKGDLSGEDLAFLILHYVDDYTSGTDWVVPFDGERNDLERRIDKLEGNDDYSNLNEVVKKFEGETAFQAQRRVGRLIQERLAELVSQESGIRMLPDLLPEEVDREILRRIA
jgi:hypothetical protein